jgi:hypothetical protein
MKTNQTACPRCGEPSSPVLIRDRARMRFACESFVDSSGVFMQSYHCRRISELLQQNALLREQLKQRKPPKPLPEVRNKKITR